MVVTETDMCLCVYIENWSLYSTMRVNCINMLHYFLHLTSDTLIRGKRYSAASTIALTSKQGNNKQTLQGRREQRNWWTKTLESFKATKTKCTLLTQIQSYKNFNCIFFFFFFFSNLHVTFKTGPKIVIVKTKDKKTKKVWVRQAHSCSVKESHLNSIRENGDKSRYELNSSRKTDIRSTKSTSWYILKKGRPPVAYIPSISGILGDTGVYKHKSRYVLNISRECITLTAGLRTILSML